MSNIWLRQTFEKFINGVESSADNGVAAHFGGVLLRDADRDRILVDVQTDIMHDFIHGCLVNMVTNDPASCRISNCVDRSASADNPRLQPESNTRSFTLLSHRV